MRVPALSASGGGSYPVVQNIVNGNSYVFKIRLECGPVLVARVLSPWSEESEVVTPRGTAEELTEPQGLSVVPVRVPGRDTAALRLTWGHPSSGAPDRYRLQYYRAPAAEMDPPWTSVTLLGSSQSYEITGLSFNAEYQIRLRAEAENARPDCEVAPGRVRPCGPWATVSGTTGNENGAPTATNNPEPIILEFGTSRDIDLAHFFSDPDGDMLTFAAFSQNTQIVTATVSGSTVTITGVNTGTTSVSVSATDPGGLSARTSIEITVQEEQVADPPAEIEAFIGPAGPAVIWEPPPAQGGVTITGYEVSWRDDFDRVWSETVLVSGGAAARTWAPMIDAVSGGAGRTYEFRLRTVSAPGRLRPLVRAGGHHRTRTPDSLRPARRRGVPRTRRPSRGLGASGSRGGC